MEYAARPPRSSRQRTAVAALAGALTLYVGIGHAEHRQLSGMVLHAAGICLLLAADVATVFAKARHVPLLRARPHAAAFVESRTASGALHHTQSRASPAWLQRFLR